VKFDIELIVGARNQVWILREDSFSQNPLNEVLVIDKEIDNITHYVVTVEYNDVIRAFINGKRLLKKYIHENKIV
jgi:hypothetical protein